MDQNHSDDQPSAFSKTPPVKAGNATPRFATPADSAEIARAIGLAFFDDPVSEFLIPDESKRAAAFGRFAELAIDQFGRDGATIVTSPVQGAGIWQAPTPRTPGAWSQIWTAIRLGFLLGSGFSRAAQLNETMEANHYREPHWYLAILGVEPEAQGRGLGALLMQPLLDRCDTDGTDAYLESSKESNIPFYQRFGFEVTGELKVPNGPTLWPMLRKPC